MEAVVRSNNVIGRFYLTFFLLVFREISQVGGVFASLVSCQFIAEGGVCRRGFEGVVGNIPECNER